MKLLLIDDDADDRELFTEAAARINPQIYCQTASDGVEGLETLDKDPVWDFIFLDLNMPRMNGIEVLRHIRMRSELKDVPVIIYTTSKSDTHKFETRKLGAHDFITKPSNFTKLVEAIANAIHIYQGFSLSTAGVTVGK